MVAGPEFGPSQCHNLIIVKALCELRTSGLRWHESLADCLRCMGFEQCNMEPNAWLCPHEEDHYECITICVDDLLITHKDPKSTTHVLTIKHYFKLKGMGPISYHLDYYFGRDDDSVLHFAPKDHIDTMIDCY